MSTDGGIDDGVDKGVRILSFDSGGPGTYSQLLIIREYMVRLASDLGVDEKDVYPADYFDLMGGVGFGGLVAILLGHLRMNVDEAIEALLEVAMALFPDISPDLDEETRTRQLSESVKSILRTRGIAPETKMQDKDERSARCKVALYAATTTDVSHPIVLRNYKPRRPSLNVTIVEAICATLVTPSYFSPIKVGPRGRQQTFIGGPRGANNPTRELLKEASAIFGNEKLAAQIISLGCGRSYISTMEKNPDIEGVSRSTQEMAADCEGVAKELSTRLCDVDAYLRLNVDKWIENAPMNKWHDLGPIETHTNAYVEMAKISQPIEASLQRLQGSNGTVTLGEINHPRAAKDIQDKVNYQKEELDRTYRVVKDNGAFQILERLKPVDAPSYYENRSCMKDTRKLILDYLVTQATTPSEKNNASNDSTPKNMFWLYGSPGLGKTAVANTLCQRLHKAGNLGGSFFCRRDDPILCDANRVLPTLLYRLARMSGPYRDLVVQALRGDPNLNPDWTGCALLLQNLYSLQNYPNTPLVLVIDALDESGDPRTRAPLLRCLSEICSHVDWIKIVVTSRPEHDITGFFQRLDIVGHDLSEDDQAHEDIRIFTRYRMNLLAKQYHLPTDWPGQSRLEQIARRSGGLFIFVETLYQYLDDPDPELLLNQVLGGTLQGANAELHKLYSTAIETRIGRNKEHFHLFIQALVVTAAHRSLPDKTLASLIGLEPRVISSWVDNLSSLLYRDVSENGGIRARHLSVIEFLTDSTCPLGFRVDVRKANGQLAHRCLITMTKELKFNICQLETSCVLNADIQDLDSRVQERISPALQYSSMYWSSHLGSAASEGSELLNAFLTGTQLLYWLEVLSLIGEVPAAIQALRLVKLNFKQFEDRHRGAVEDALRFVLTFFTLISTSAPHIYISGLAFMPEESSLWKCASLSFPELLHVCKGRMKYWQAPAGVWQGHTSDIFSVSYSPDGLNVASGSNDKTIRIWDAETGAAVGDPLTGHTDQVRSVAYSPDGRNIVSGSSDRTIRTWDAETGASVRGPLMGHTDEVWSVTYSPDGRSIASSSNDRTIRIWDAGTGEKVGEPLRGHTDTIRSVAYSPDGRNIVSGSDDETIQIWDVETGVAVGEPLRGHSDSVQSVVYSPDGRNVASSSNDCTVRIWDAKTGETVGGPLQGHADWVLSIAYSPDGLNIISGSADCMVRIWDAGTGAAAGEPLQGHTNWVRSVAYSPDGPNVVSGSGDMTVRLWDAETGAAAREPLKQHTGSVWSVACSPDGRSLVSGSYDKTIRIWDVEAGVAVGEPLKGHTGPVWSVTYSPNGQNVVSGSSDRTIRIWDLQTGATIWGPLKGHTGNVYSVAFSPDGRNIVSGSYDMTIRVWDAKTGEAIGEPLRGHVGVVWSVIYSPDGQNIVSGSADKTIRVWDARTGAAVGMPLTGHTDWVWSVKYSPDGRNIVSGSKDKTLRIWDAETGAAVGDPLTGHTDQVWSVAYSPDGRNIVSSSDDKTIRFWDAETQKAVGKPLHGHTGSVFSISYSPDGRSVISGSRDTTIRVWEAPKNTYRDDNGAISESSDLSNDHLPLNALSGIPIPPALLDSNGWVRSAEGPLFWVPEDSRNGLTCPAITIIPNTGRHRLVRIEFSRFHYGTSWTKIRGDNVEGRLQ